jgi:hypothetical protein
MISGPTATIAFLTALSSSASSSLGSAGLPNRRHLTRRPRCPDHIVPSADQHWNQTAADDAGCSGQKDSHDWTKISQARCQARHSRRTIRGRTAKFYAAARQPLAANAATSRGSRNPDPCSLRSFAPERNTILSAGGCGSVSTAATAPWIATVTRVLAGPINAPHPPPSVMGMPSRPARRTVPLRTRHTRVDSIRHVSRAIRAQHA